MSYGNPTIPLSYTVPSFPSLYWPIRVQPGTAKYLYYIHDIWKFTLYWTFLIYGAVHLLVATWAVLMQFRSAHQRLRIMLPHLSAKNKVLIGENPIRETLGWVWIIPVIYVVIGGLEAMVAGSIVGSVIGAVYNAGNFKMSTWTPFIWSLINTLVLILSSFRIQGGL